MKRNQHLRKCEPDPTGRWHVGDFALFFDTKKRKTIRVQIIAIDVDAALIFKGVGMESTLLSRLKSASQEATT